MTTETKNIRESETYKSLDTFTATGYAEGFIEATEDQWVAAWQYLHDTKLAYQLQGWFGRAAVQLVERGIILP